MEVWKDILGFENYQISNYGNVKKPQLWEDRKTQVAKTNCKRKRLFASKVIEVR